MAIEYILIVVERLYRIYEILMINNNLNNRGISELLDGAIPEFNELQLEIIQYNNSLGAGDYVSFPNRLQKFIVIFNQIQNYVKY